MVEGTAVLPSQEVVQNKLEQPFWRSRSPSPALATSENKPRGVEGREVEGFEDNIHAEEEAHRHPRQQKENSFEHTQSWP